MHLSVEQFVSAERRLSQSLCADSAIPVPLSPPIAGADRRAPGKVRRSDPEDTSLRLRVGHGVTPRPPTTGYNRPCVAAAATTTSPHVKT